MVNGPLVGLYGLLITAHSSFMEHLDDTMGSSLQKVIRIVLPTAERTMGY
jgi:hypothetical protein